MATLSRVRPFLPLFASASETAGECVVPLPAVLDAAGVALVMLLADGGRRVVLDAAELREVRPDARAVLESLLPGDLPGAAPLRVENLGRAARRALAGSPLLALAPAPAPADDDALFLCPDRDEAGFRPSGR